jgi:hypothetical protein
MAIALFVGLAASAFERLTGPLTQLTTPGRATLELPAGAERTIYQQVRDSAARIAVPATADPECAVTLVRGGWIEVADASAFTLTRDGDRYEALFDFDATRGGAYRVSCEDRTRPQREVPLAIGRTIGLLGLLGDFGVALGTLFGGLAIATAIAVVTAVRRDGHKRRLQREPTRPGAAAGPRA